jgi:hypothetical protein
MPTVLTTTVLPRPTTTYEYVRGGGPTVYDKENQIPHSVYTEKEKAISSKYNDLSEKISTEMSEKSTKRKYMYNCFSAIDEAVNTQCGSCGSNEIIARKPETSWE